MPQVKKQRVVIGDETREITVRHYTRRDADEARRQAAAANKAAASPAQPNSSSQKETRENVQGPGQ